MYVYKYIYIDIYIYIYIYNIYNWIVLNNLIDFCFCFNEEEIKYTTVRSYGARWVKDIKYSQKCFNKQQIKDAVAYLLFNCYFNVASKRSTKLLILLWRIPSHFYAKLFLFFVKVSG